MTQCPTPRPYIAGFTENQFRHNYTRAREDQADSLADEILEIADDGTNDWMERRGEDGSSGYVINGEHVQRSRLRVESRKWIASKLKPKKYGDKITQELSGPDGGPIDIQETQLQRLSPETLNELLAISSQLASSPDDGAGETGDDPA